MFQATVQSKHTSYCILFLSSPLTGLGNSKRKEDYQLSKTQAKDTVKVVLTTVALHKKGRNGLSLLAANLAITINPSPPKSEREVSLIPAVNSL